MCPTKREARQVGVSWRATHVGERSPTEGEIHALHGTVRCKLYGFAQGAWILARAPLRRQLPTCLQCTPKSSILSSGMVWYSLGPSSGGL